MAPGSSGSGGGAPWIPLREDYFETPLLSHKETQYLVRKACEAAQEVVERARSAGGPVQWRHVEKYNDVQLYAGFSRGTYSAEPTTMCGVTSVPGSLKEIASLFDLGTTRAMKDFSRAHRELFFDGVVLHTLRPRTREHPLHQVTAKWIATRSPKGLDDRDYCYLECQDKFTDSAGRKGWVLCLHSIKLPGCDDLSREFGFVRGSFYHSGLVVVEADRPGFVDIIHMLQMNLKNNTKMPPAYLRERVAWVGKIKTVLREKRLNEQRYLSDLELVPKKYRSRCHVCQDSFSLLLLRKMNCRKCGEVVCGACSKDFDVTNAKFLETVKLRICMHCYQLITAGQMLGTILDEPRASTSLSLLGYYDDTQRASIITEALPTNNGGGYGHAHGRGGRDRPAKIILHSMAQQRADRRARRTVNEANGHGHGAYPAQDPRSRRQTHHRGAAPPPPPNSNGNGYAYGPPPDSRSLFDKPRGNSHDNFSIPSPVPGAMVASPSTPASLFDRQSSRSRQDDYDGSNGNQVDDRGRGSGQHVAPSPHSSDRKSRGSTRESRGNFTIPHSLYDHSTNDAGAPSSPVQRARGDSNSSASSTGSIDIDSYEVVRGGHASSGKNAAPTIDEGQSYQTARTLPRDHRDNDGDDGEDTEGSMGSGDDEPSYKPRERPSKPRDGPTYYEDEEEEETKTDEFGATPALPPPSPSAYTGVMENTLLASGRDDDLPFQRRNFNMSDLSVNTADCDTSYLDTQMRQFHGQPFYMRGTTTDSDPRATINFSDASSPRSRAATELSAPAGEPTSSAPSQTSRESVGSAVAPTVTSPRRHMTSPEKPASMVIRPPLYGRPKKIEMSSMQRESTTSLVPSSLSSGDADVINDSILLADPAGRQTFQMVGNDSLLSVAPSTHSNEDLTFKPDANHARGSTPSVSSVAEEGASTQAKRPEPPKPAARRVTPSGLPSYVPSRFQTRLQPVKEPLSQEEVESKRLSEEQLLRSDEEKIERLIGRDSASHMQNVRSSAGSPTNQDDIEDVDFEELLRMSKLEQEQQGKIHRPQLNPSPLVRGQTFDPSRASVDTDLGEFHDSSGSESEDESELLSARQIYRRFDSSKRLATVAGVDQNETFQRKFEQIKEHIHMLSDSEDDSDSGEENPDWSADGAKQQLQKLTL